MNWSPDIYFTFTPGIPGGGVICRLSPQFWFEAISLGIGVDYVQLCATNDLTLLVVLNVWVHPNEGNCK